MTQQLVEQIRKQAIRLDTYDDLDALVDAVGDANIVLLGEASHGTSEFYTLRAELSKRLIERKGFNFIGVEGDWPACYTLNRYIKGYSDAPKNTREALQDFNRWPTWMWANAETAALADWLKAYNDKQPTHQKVGFYGLDMYSLWESMESIIQYLETNGLQEELEKAKAAFACFEPFSRDEQTYGISAAYLSEGCEEEVVNLLTALRSERREYAGDEEEVLSAELNALVAVHAEQYYRSMVRGGNDSWNIRDHHMVQALNRLIEFHGSGAKAIVWEHNTHIGDARATDMAAEGMVNVGQLVREQNKSENVYAIGFGTHRGTVVAATSWGAQLQSMPVPPAMKGSWEDLMHRAGDYDQILFLGAENPHFQEEIGHRAIGVVYHPKYERRGNYVPSRMAQRYDAFIFVDETRALQPLVVEEVFR